MLSLYTFGPYFGMPDASPFCIKALLLMKMSGLPHDVKKVEFSKMPKGKAPYLQSNGKLIGDSHFIQMHLEEKFGVDFSGGYSAVELAKGYAVARMLEEHLYFLMVQIRWADGDNFQRGPSHFFDDAPAVVRPFIRWIVRKGIFKTLKLQGLGLHTFDERLELAKSDIVSVETMLGQNKYFLGDRVSGVDAVITGFLWSASCSHFDSPAGEFLRSRPLIMSYLARMVNQYLPEYKV